MEDQTACQFTSPESPEKYILSMHLFFFVCTQFVFPIEVLEHDTVFNLYPHRESFSWLPLSRSTRPDGELLKCTSEMVPW